MSVELISEDELRAALRPRRPDAQTFEAKVRERLAAMEQEQKDDPLAGLPPLVRGAAALVPVSLMSGAKVSAAAVKAAPVGGIYKLLAAVVFPAVSMFLLLGSLLLAGVRIRGVTATGGEKIGDTEGLVEATQRWWQHHQRGFWLVFLATIVLQWIGYTWILFLVYIASLALLAYVISALAKVGLGNRQIVGQSCLMSLGILGQLAMFAGSGDQDIHLVDQHVISAIFLAGALLLGTYLVRNGLVPSRLAGSLRWVAYAVQVAIVVPLCLWLLSPLWPISDARIRSHVESFDRAQFDSATWQQWVIPARWTVDAGLHPDMAKPRELLDRELAADVPTLPLILSCASRAGVLPADQIDQLPRYREELRSLLDISLHQRDPQRILSLAQKEWVIRAAILKGDLSDADRDYLAKSLHATLHDDLEDGSGLLFEELWLATDLLAALGRPVDPDEYRAGVQLWLLKGHTTQGGGFKPAGGFLDHPNQPARVNDSLRMKLLGFFVGRIGSHQATAYAVELMEIYGVPEGLDINWVRTFTKPSFSGSLSDDKWVAAVTRQRLEHLPGVASPTWPERLYYERNLLAAIVVVGLCFYATLISPKSRVIEAAGNRLDLRFGRWSDAPAVYRRLIWTSMLLGLAMLGLLLWILESTPQPLPPVRPVIAPPPVHRPPPPHRPHRGERSAE